MILENLLDGGPSHSGSLLEPFESIRGGTLSTNPHQQLSTEFKNQVLWHEIVECFFTELIK
jgi:hypothetical protein